MSITDLSICKLSLSSDVGSGAYRFAMKSVKIALSSAYRNSPFLLNKYGDIWRAYVLTVQVDQHHKYLKV